jgi:hypothetical protein
MWRKALKGYNWISKNQQLPVIGKPLFSILDSLLAIDPLNENRGRRKRSLPLSLVEYAVNSGACDDLSKCNGGEMVLTSFYTPAIYFSKKKTDVKVYCQICDTDLSRVWVPRNLSKNIIYLATCTRAYKRLLSYGVAKANIHITGFPLPNELVGGVGQSIAIKNYNDRLARFNNTLEKVSSNKPLRLFFAIGGAGAQIEIALQAARSLVFQIMSGEIEFVLIAPSQSNWRKSIDAFKSKFFRKCQFFRVEYPDSLADYFSTFSDIIATTDVLWTKPSELSFYSALGIPIIISPPIGAQERANREWLIETGAGIDQMNPKSAHIWFKNLVISGSLKRMAIRGWETGIRTGAYTSLEIIGSMQLNGTEKGA